MQEYVTLIDPNDNIIWKEEKLKAHELWLLHRAFSVLVFNKEWELLLEQREKNKYHCWWLWANTVCSHPRSWENYEEAAHRRLKEEFWFDCDIEHKFDMPYKASFENWLIEHELDKIFIWYYDWPVKPNPEEIMDYKWIDIENLKKDIKSEPEKYTPRFKLIMERWE